MSDNSSILWKLDVFLIIMSVVMFQNPILGKRTAAIGLTSGVLMMIPSTAGTIGMIFALLSLVPWAIFSILVARKLFWLSGQDTNPVINLNSQPLQNS